MRAALVVLFLFCSLSSNARAYYVNPSSDSSKELGSISYPWKSLGSVNASMKMFRPGDTIFLKKGELYYEGLRITCSGKENAAIVFMSYGPAAAKPVFLYKRQPLTEGILLSRCSYIVIDGFEITDDNLDPNEHSRTANTAFGVNIVESNFITVKNVDISRVGIGVSVDGNRNKIDNCRIKNLKLIRNTVGGADDYGANGIVMAGSDNTVSNCFFKDCWSNSFDYTYYGGVIKMAGTKTSNNNKIANNISINCDGFMEVAGSANSSFNNNIVSNNTLINNGELIYISNTSNSRPLINHFVFVNNCVVNTINRLPNPPFLIGIKMRYAAKGMVDIRNNVFWLISGMDVAREGQVSQGELIHRNNIFYLSGGKLNFAEDISDKVLNKNSEPIKILSSKHPELHDMDLFPFVYLLRFLDKFIY